MSLGYEITIRRTRMVEKNIGNKWAVVSHDEGGKGEFGYTPIHTGQAEESEEIYKQVVSDIDLVKVIDAVNDAPDRGASGIPSKDG